MILVYDLYVTMKIDTIQDIHVLQVLFQLESICLNEVCESNNRSLLFFFRPSVSHICLKTQKETIKQ